MCRRGNDALIHLNQRLPYSGRTSVWVDACIAPLVQLLNDAGVQTEGCCCGHEQTNGSILYRQDGAVVEMRLAPMMRISPERDQARDALASLGRRAVSDVLRERLRQDAKWGEQNHDPFCYLAVLIEEVGEFAQAALHARFGGEAAEHLRKEAVHAAAVALALVECLDRGSWSWGAHALAGGPR